MKWATTVQDILTLAKVFALIMIIVMGLNYLVQGRSDAFEDPMAGTNWSPVLIATAFYQTMYAYAGWSVLVRFGIVIKLFHLVK